MDTGEIRYNDVAQRANRLFTKFCMNYVPNDIIDNPLNQIFGGNLPKMINDVIVTYNVNTVRKQDAVPNKDEQDEYDYHILLLSMKQLNEQGYLDNG